VVESAWVERSFETERAWHHAAGRRGSGESVFKDGQDVTDTLHPDEWPTFDRRAFYELGWRPWTPPGVTPVWWSVVEDHEPTASAGELARRRPFGGTLLRSLAKEPPDPELLRRRRART